MATALLGVMLVGGVLVVAGCGDDSADLPAGVVAKVGDTSITQEQLDSSLAQTVAAYESQGQAAPAEGTDEYNLVRQQALQTLVQQQIITNEAAECGNPCAVTDGAVQKELKGIIANEFDGKQKQFQDFLKERKMSRADALGIVRNSLLQQKLFEHVTKDVTFTAKDARAYYAEHRDEFHTKAGRTVSHILVPGKAKAEQLRAKVTAANFAQIAKADSTDTGSAQQGGSLGTVEKGQMVPEFEKAAFALKDGQISQPVKSQFGWHIIMAKLTPAHTTPFAEAKDGIIANQLQQAQQTTYSEWADKAIEKWGDETVYADDDLKPSTTTEPETQTAP